MRKIFLLMAIMASVSDAGASVDAQPFRNGETVLFKRSATSGRGFRTSAQIWALGEVIEIGESSQLRIRDWSHPSRYGLDVRSSQGERLLGIHLMDRHLVLRRVARWKTSAGRVIAPGDSWEVIRARAGRNRREVLPIVWLFQGGHAVFFHDRDRERRFREVGVRVFSEGPARVLIREVDRKP